LRLALAEAQKVSAEKNMRRRANRVREASRRGYGSPPVANRGSTVRVPADERETLLPKHGGYENTITWQLADLIYDVTVRFCDKSVDRRSRTHDQMVQAARSGAQNLQEGSVDSAVSKKIELNLCIHLIGRQRQAQADTFEKEGGFTERLCRIRSARRPA